MDNPLTLQEAKDQVAKNIGYENWEKYLNWNSANPTQSVSDDVAELYARSKSEQIWVPVNSYENYEISSFGHVRTEKQYLTTSKNNNGYYRVNLCSKSDQHAHFIHHLVAEHFIGPRPDGCVVMHIDNNRVNNHVSNLKYGTQSDNLQQAIDEGRKPSVPSRLKIPQDKIDYVIALRHSGMGLKQIEIVSSIPLSTLQKIFTRNKVYAPKPEFKP